MFRYIAFVLLAVSLTVNAETGPLALSESGVLAEPPLCVVDGELIKYHPAETKMLWKMGAFLAIATINPETEKREILLDGKFFPASPPPFQYYVMMHECAHHKLGHVSKEAFASISPPDGAETFEAEADCRALKKAEDVFTDEDFEKVFEFMTDRRFMGAASKGVALSTYAEIAHSWTLEERVQKARECVGREKSERHTAHK